MTTDRNAIPSRVAERYPGEPVPADMLRDLQSAIYGTSFASPYPPADLWAHMIEMVRNRDLPGIEDEDERPDCSYCRGSGLSPYSIRDVPCRHCGGQG